MLLRYAPLRPEDIGPFFQVIISALIGLAVVGKQIPLPQQAQVAEVRCHMLHSGIPWVVSHDHCHVQILQEESGLSQTPQPQQLLLGVEFEPAHVLLRTLPAARTAQRQPQILPIVHLGIQVLVCLRHAPGNPTRKHSS